MEITIAIETQTKGKADFVCDEDKTTTSKFMHSHCELMIKLQYHVTEDTPNLSINLLQIHVHSRLASKYIYMEVIDIV